MKKLLTTSLLCLAAFLGSFTLSMAATCTSIFVGGTGVCYGTGYTGGFTSGTLLTGNGSSPIATTTVGSGLSLSGGVLTATGGGGTPGGASSTVQYNANGSFAGNTGLAYTGTNLGIGTSSPMSQLSVAGNLNQYGAYSHFGLTAPLSQCNTALGASSCLELVGNDNTTGGVGIYAANTNSGTSAYGGYVLTNNLTGNATTNYSGLFLNSSNYSDTTFGTMNAVQNLLQVGDSMGPVSIQSFAPTAAGSYINFYAASTTPGLGPMATGEGMRLNATGLGIGSTSPDATLGITGTGHIAGTAATPLTLERTSSNTNYNMLFKGGASSIYAGGTGSTFVVGSAADLSTAANRFASFSNTGAALYESGTAAVTLDSSGRFGVATTSPGSLLSIQGTAGPQFVIGYDATHNGSFNVDSTGLLTINGTAGVNSNGLLKIQGIFQTSLLSGAASSDIASGGATTASNSATAQVLATGSTAVDYRALFRGSSATTITANSSYANAVVGSTAATLSGSGTVPLVSSLQISPVAMTSGTASTTNAATLYIDGQATGTGAPTNNFSLYNRTGTSYFGGNVGMATTSPTAQVGIGMASTTNALVVGVAGSSTPAFEVDSANSNGAVKVAGVPDRGTYRGTSGSIGGGVLTAGTCTSGTVNITGVDTTMVVNATPVTYPGDGSQWDAYVSSSGVVTVKVCAVVALTPGATTYNVSVSP